MFKECQFIEEFKVNGFKFYNFKGHFNPNKTMTGIEKFNVGDIIQSWKSQTYYQIIEITDNGNGFRLKHPNGKVYYKYGGEIDYYYHKCEITVEEFNKLPLHYKDYPDHLLKKETVASIENEEWREIKFIGLNHNYMISSLGRVKKTDHYNIKGNEILLMIHGDMGLGVKEKVNLVQHNEDNFFPIEGLLKTHFPEKVFNNYKHKEAIKLDETLEKVRIINDSKYNEEDRTFFLEENAFLLPESELIFHKRYRKDCPQSSYNPEVFCLTGFSFLSIYYIKEDNFDFNFGDIIDSVVISKESILFNKVFEHKYLARAAGRTNLEGYKILIAYIKKIPLYINKRVHQELKNLLDLHLVNEWKP